MPARHLNTGRRGEEAAAELLLASGCRILERNWRHGGLEIDLVCEQAGALVFVEVKTRREGGLGRPDEALGRAKQARLVRAARWYLTEHQCWERPCRFDLVSVTRTDQGYRAEHVPNAFDISPALARGHADWQPW